MAISALNLLDPRHSMIFASLSEFQQVLAFDSYHYILAYSFLPHMRAGYSFYASAINRIL